MSDLAARLEGLERAIRAAGGVIALAEAIGIVPSAIPNWRRRKTGIPVAQAPVVARVTGIPLHELRPDVFDPPLRARAPKRRSASEAAEAV